jgi:hypothetical protein
MFTILEANEVAWQTVSTLEAAQQSAKSLARQTGWLVTVKDATGALVGWYPGRA